MVIYFWHVSKDWKGLYLFGYFSAIAGFLALWLLPESANYLLEVRRFGELEKTLQQMARWNGKSETFHLDPALFKDCLSLFPEDNKKDSDKGEEREG